MKEVPYWDGGWWNRVERGAISALTCVTFFAEEFFFFNTSLGQRFVQEFLIIVTHVRSIGFQIPLQSMTYTQLWRPVTPEVSGLLSLLPLNRHRFITSKDKFELPFIQIQCFNDRRSASSLWKVSYFLKIFFWPEIIAFGYFQMYITSVCINPKKRSAPYPTLGQSNLLLALTL